MTMCGSIGRLVLGLLAPRADHVEYCYSTSARGFLKATKHIVSDPQVAKGSLSEVVENVVLFLSS